MSNVTFITGNPGKADFLAKNLDHPVDHKKLDLDELQSLDLQTVVDHKVRQAYRLVGSPVLVEDVGLSFGALGRLPGAFIKWFLSELGPEGICNLLDAYEDRSAIAAVCLAYFDGENLKFFNGQIAGSIAHKPSGANGYGWDAIFVRDGHDKTFAQMSDEELARYSLRTTTIYPQIKKFLADLDRIK